MRGDIHSISRDFTFRFPFLRSPNPYEERLTDVASYWATIDVLIT